MAKIQIEVLSVSPETAKELFSCDSICYINHRDGTVEAQGIDKHDGHVYSVVGDSREQIEDAFTESLISEKAEKKVVELRVA